MSTIVVLNAAHPQPDREELAIVQGRALARLAARQHGVVSRGQLKALGLNRGAIGWRVRSGRLRLVHRGVYAVGHGRLDQRGRWMAAVLACGEGTALSHASAAALWGLTRAREPVDVISCRGDRRKGIRVHHAKLGPEDWVERHGIPVTTVARTLFDYGEVVDERGLERAWEEADRLGLLKLGEIELLCERGAGRHSLRPIRRLLADGRAPARTRSPLEKRFATFCRDHGLPAPATNVLVGGREVDALWQGQRLIVELDGFSFHRHRAAFERDRARDAALVAAGYRVIRVTHRRLEEEADVIAAELRRLLAVG